ncbi:uncharacterized protein LOC134677954 [Cydia fagiglandana]|uniref:uncharacterized protein LOC134677954 n=1 Tax=Cydia fagiglandana TaxID=1458189 RepID=UPI002FEE55A2
MHTNQWRNRRNQLNLSPIPAFNMYSIANYSTDTSKTDLSKTFAEEMLIHSLHMMPNPLQKNLADTIPTAEKPKPPYKEPKLEPKAYPEPKMEKEQARTEYSFSFGSFFSGVISAISSGVFKRREPTQQYYDCFDPEPSWQTASEADLNKSTRSQSLKEDDAMSADCRSAAAHCEDKLNRVRHLLSSKPVPTTPKYRRKPKRVFVEPGSVEESFEDAFSPEDFVRLSNSNHIECISPFNNHKEEVIEAAAVRVKTEVKEVMDIVQTLPEAEIVPLDKTNNHNIETKEAIANTQVESQADVKDSQKSVSKGIIEHIGDKIEVKPDLPNVPEEIKEKQEVIAACEDKVNRLKALLQRRKPKSRLTKTESDSALEPVTDMKNKKVQDKHFKNPARTTDKRKQSQLIKSIQEDMSFGNSLDTEEVSSPDNSPILPQTKLCDMINVPKLVPEPEPEYFDEVHGRFRSASTDSDDSFQIVFTDSPKAARHHSLSDCDSEDSFIVFEDSPDSCYTSHDVFGDSAVESDSDSDVSDSGCGVSCKLSHSLTRTVGDLTDDSLFDDTVREESGDEVDSVTVCEELDLPEEVNTGLLLTDAKKLLRRQQPPKKVSFSEKPPKVHVMRVWSFAARQARRGNWEQDAMDRDRFKRKIADVDMAVSWVLKPQHRRRIMFQRFMPWWNKQRRLEIEERKRKQEEDRIAEEKREDEKRIEEERLKAEVEGRDASEINEVNTEGTKSGNGVDIKVDGVDKELNNVNGVNENGLINEKVENNLDVNDDKNDGECKTQIKTLENKIDDMNLKVGDKDKSKLDLINDKVNDVKIDLNVDKVAKSLAKCDFYDKSESKANSILASKVVLDT